MMKTPKFEILMLDSNYLNLSKATPLPGVPGAVEDKKDLPGLYGVEGNDCPHCKGTGKVSKEAETDEVPKGTEPITDKKNLFTVLKSFFSGQSSYSTPANYYEQDGVSVIEINGEIAKRLSPEQKASGMTDIDDVAKCFKLAKSSDSQLVVLKINSPGGSPIGLNETCNILCELSEAKPVFTFCDIVCASAAYQIASFTNGIYVTPSSKIGSVGVIARVYDQTKNLEMNGIKVHVFTGGDMKSMGHADTSLTEKQAEYLKSQIDKETVEFRQLVSENRGGVKEEYLQGQVLDGKDAIEANLADELVNDFDSFMEQMTS